MKFLGKFLSRKFVAAVLGVITGIALIFGVDGEMISTVSGTVISVASLVTYITVEGKIDAAGKSGEAAEAVESDGQ